MILKTKICGVSDSKTLAYITNHNSPPQYVGFVVNYPKSKRYVNLEKLNKLLKIDKKKCLYVAVLVNPDQNILEQIKNLPFDYYQVYDCNPEQLRSIKKKYQRKIITAITVKDKDDIKKFELYSDIADIFLFDSKGYEKSEAFNHNLISDIKINKKLMIAGNIKYDDELENYGKIADFIDLSGGLETSGLKDLSKIEIFLNKMKQIQNEN